MALLNFRGIHQFAHSPPPPPKKKKKNLVTFIRKIQASSILAGVEGPKQLASRGWLGKARLGKQQ